MFVDIVEIQLQAGKGGDGLVSFRREKYVDKGGPNGGDGGDGGSIIFRACENVYDLNKFRFNKLVKANDGQNGGSNNKRGRSAEAVIVDVPIGTVIFDLLSNQVIADLDAKNQQIIVAKGGMGGFGNAHFKSSIKRIPLVAEKGLRGEIKNIKCELKLLAEVGLVGLPNSGKSTFLKVATNANPKIGSYAFTTLEPHLGVTKNGCLIADIPGLIKGASEGKGLGHKFLRHIERNLVLLHLIDCQIEAVEEAYLQILDELKKYNELLLQIPQLVALTKIETVNKEDLNKQIAKLESVLKKDHKLYSISTMANINLDNLLVDLKKEIINRKKTLRVTPPEDNYKVFKLDNTSNFLILKQQDCFLVTGAKIESFASKTDFDNFHSRQRLRDILKKMGIVKQLMVMGYNGDRIVFGESQIGELYLNELEN